MSKRTADVDAAAQAAHTLADHPEVQRSGELTQLVADLLTALEGPDEG